MRYGCLFGGVFWGVVLVLLGISLFLNSVLGIRIPVFELLFALFLVYLGLRLLTGRRRWGWHRHADWQGWSRRDDMVKPGDHHDIIFGRGDIDLTRVAVGAESVHVEINVVFGAGLIEVDSRMPVKIIATSAFGGVRLPDGNATAFGEYFWKSSSQDDSKPYLMVHVACVFGGVRIQAR